MSSNVSSTTISGLSSQVWEMIESQYGGKKMNKESKKEIYLAGGCFWGTQMYFDAITGVIETDVGYANGDTENPTYEDVCYNNTGHAEAVKVVYDSEKLKLEKLLDLYYEVINPVSVNRQGGDIGVQYRTGIYYVDEKDLQIIEPSIRQLQMKYEKPIAIEVETLDNYYSAEEYHQKYLEKNPTGYCHISRQQIENVKNI